MKNIIFILIITTCFTTCKQKESQRIEKVNNKSEVLADTTNSENWVYLFDGKSFENWRGYLTDTMALGWSIEDNAMVFTPGVTGRNNIISKNKYSNFVLSLEWKIAPGGNSGIFWGIFEDPKYPEPYESGPEIQILDNAGHPYGKEEGGEIYQAGSLFGIVAPSSDVYKPEGEWNSFIIKIDHMSNKGSVQLNGIHILNFPVNGEQWNALIADTKFKDWPEFGKHKSGHIGLQDHGSKVWFRNIKIKELYE